MNTHSSDNRFNLLSDTQPQDTLPCQAWQLVLPIEGTGINSGVSAVEHQGKLYAFYNKGSSAQDGIIGYAIVSKHPNNQLVLEGLHELPTEPGIQYRPLGGYRPAVTVYQNRLFCFYRDTSGGISFSVGSGAFWENAQQVPNVLTSDAPSVAALGEQLFLVLRGTEGGDFYHKVLEPSGWQPHQRDPHIKFNGSPSLCIAGGLPTVAVKGLDERLYLFNFHESGWAPVLTSTLNDIYEAPAVAGWDRFLVDASLKRSNNHYSTELVRSPTELNDYYQTAGAYTSPPCLVNYHSDLYLIGKRPCDDLGISIFNPECIK
ncbi:hypothetical protein [Pseudomonas lundensis]|uniref:hypothetical protein n=1 Tax=Pseudomonas lundensis TaxID=86185 RepID=UPI0014746CE7|nr:hypothetical protein [Pseudomonas lundensis]NNA17633.1 hypothetical protein [Pseudomonas lundensis]